MTSFDDQFVSQNQIYCDIQNIKITHSLLYYTTHLTPYTAHTSHSSLFYTIWIALTSDKNLDRHYQHEVAKMLVAVVVPLPSGSLPLVSLSLRNYESPFEHQDLLHQAKKI